MQNKFFNSKTNTILLLILVVLMIIALRWMSQDKMKYFGTSQTFKPVTQIPQDKNQSQVSSNEKQFSGTITKRDDGCFADGLCFIQIDNNYWVLHTKGWTPTLGTVEGDLNVGSKVEVYAEKYNEESSYKNTYSIIGNSKYYIKVTNQEYSWILSPAKFGSMVLYPSNWKITPQYYGSAAMQAGGEESLVGYNFTLPSGSMVMWGGAQSGCGEKEFGDFKYATSSITCLKGYRTSIGRASARESLSINDLKIFGDFVLKNK